MCDMIEIIVIDRKKSKIKLKKKLWLNKSLLLSNTCTFYYNFGTLKCDQFKFTCVTFIRFKKESRVSSSGKNQRYKDWGKMSEGDKV